MFLAMPGRLQPENKHAKCSKYSANRIFYNNIHGSGFDVGSCSAAESSFLSECFHPFFDVATFGM